jgi:hypothetical protein
VIAGLSMSKENYSAINNNSPSKSASEEEEVVEEEEEEIDADSVSDAEALLACRAYLQRKNRLGEWTQFERRKRMKEVAFAKPKFWEDPSELTYLKDPNNNNDLLLDEDDNNAIAAANADAVAAEVLLEQETTEEAVGSSDYRYDYGVFSCFPSAPSQSRLNRSRAAKRTWSDPKWKEEWYKRRWGSKSKADRMQNKIKSANEKRLKDRVRDLPPGFLGSPELASMSEDEIAEAIRSFIRSNRKRVSSRAETLKKRKETLQEPPPPRDQIMLQKPLARDSLLMEDPEAMKEARRKRSELAKKLYQTRLKNKAELLLLESATRKPSKKRFRKEGNLPAGPTPMDALLRIEGNLDEGNLPQVDDVQLILIPTKLGKRKELFYRILSECFDMRGKCVPKDLNDPQGDTIFATQSSIPQLGNFVISLLQSVQ